MEDTKDIIKKTELNYNKIYGYLPKKWIVKDIKNYIGYQKSGLSRRIVEEDIGIPVIISGNIQNNKLDVNELKYWYYNDPQGAKIEDYILDKKDILLCFINSIDQIGKVCLYKNIGRNSIYTTNLFRIKVNDDCIPEYLYYLLASSFVQNQIKQIIKPAVNQASFTKKEFEKIQVPFIEKNEQLNIVSVLKRQDKLIEKTEQVIEKYQKIKKGLMDDLLTGKVRIKDGKIFTECNLKSEKDLGVMSEKWNVSILGELVDIINGYAFSSNDSIEKGIRWLKIANVGFNEIKWDEKSFLPIDFVHKYHQYLVRKGDIVIALTRPIINNKLKISKFESEKETALLNQRVCKLEPKEIDDKGYIYYVIQYISSIKQIELKLLGTDPPNISSVDLKNVRVPIPDKEERIFISKILFKQDKLIEKEQQYLEKLKKIKAGLMEDLLTGKVRVK